MSYRVCPCGADKCRENDHLFWPRDTVCVDDIVSTRDIARRAGVKDPAVSNWAARHESFPDPLTVVSSTTPLYSWMAVKRWLIYTERLDPNA